MNDKKKYLTFLFWSYANLSGAQTPSCNPNEITKLRDLFIHYSKSKQKAQECFRFEATKDIQLFSLSLAKMSTLSGFACIQTNDKFYIELNSEKDLAYKMLINKNIAYELITQSSEKKLIYRAHIEDTPIEQYTLILTNLIKDPYKFWNHFRANWNCQSLTDNQKGVLTLDLTATQPESPLPKLSVKILTSEKDAPILSQFIFKGSSNVELTISLKDAPELNKRKIPDYLLAPEGHTLERWN